MPHGDGSVQHWVIRLPVVQHLRDHLTEEAAFNSTSKDAPCTLSVQVACLGISVLEGDGKRQEDFQQLRYGIQRPMLKWTCTCQTNGRS
jgi:hypothetical protein